MKIIKNVYYWIWNAFIHRTHLVNTGLPIGNWNDADTRMLYACMSLLVEFIEGEYGLEEFKEACDISAYCVEITILPWYEKETIEYHIEKNKELLAIYEWWKAYLKKDEELKDAYKRNAKGYECHRNQLFVEFEKMEEQENEMLIRLIKVRGGLWT